MMSICGNGNNRMLTAVIMWTLPGMVIMTRQPWWWWRKMPLIWHGG
jgi:hypothetical protein